MRKIDCWGCNIYKESESIMEHFVNNSVSDWVRPVPYSEGGALRTRPVGVRVSRSSLLCEEIFDCLSAKECADVILAFRKEMDYIEYFMSKSDLKSNLIVQLLLPRCLRLLSPMTIYRYFDLIWDCLDLANTPEEFFIKNSYLISTSKLRRLKHCATKFESEKCLDPSGPPCRVIAYEKRPFSSKFTMEFPEYLTLQICYECAEITDATGKLCENCAANRCAKCGFVNLPIIVVNQSTTSSCTRCFEEDPARVS